MIRWKRIPLACAFLISTAYVPSPAVLKAQQRYIIEGWPIKKAWGPIRATYFDPQHHELRMVFEDAAGTVRIVTINPDAETAVAVCEMQRE